MATRLARASARSLVLWSLGLAGCGANPLGWHPLFASNDGGRAPGAPPQSSEPAPSEAQPEGSTIPAPPAAIDFGLPAVHQRVSSTSLCYEHDCNGASTGRRCFSDPGSFCQSLCAENKCSARLACQRECS